MGQDNSAVRQYTNSKLNPLGGALSVSGEPKERDISVERADSAMLLQETQSKREEEKNYEGDCYASGVMTGIHFKLNENLVDSSLVQESINQ